MRFLLDTNILVPLEDSQIPLHESYANFVRLAHENGHQLIYHPASEDDICRDRNETRRQQTLSRLRQYTRLEAPPRCPWNAPGIRENDACDNAILFALECEAAHALITEDRGIHDKARARGLSSRVYSIQTAEDWLRRLHDQISVQLPNIQELYLYEITPLLSSQFFDSLRLRYSEFDAWFRESARQDTKAWVSWESPGSIGAICIFKQQRDEMITRDGSMLRGQALKLSTLKVGPAVRGRKIGELFLKAAFRYASVNHLEHIFIHGDQEEHHLLFELLEDFGFSHVGTHPGANERDAVYLKEQPIVPPVDDTIDNFTYMRRYFPHFRAKNGVKKFVLPIRPCYHRVLFPDYQSPFDWQMSFLGPATTAGNAIKMAYLCRSQIRDMAPGDIVLFYRSVDERAITSVGIIEDYRTLSDAETIARHVSRRTVYSMREIAQMASKPTRVMLFRLIRHFRCPPNYEWLLEGNIISGHIQSIRRLSDAAYDRIIAYAD